METIKKNTVIQETAMEELRKKAGYELQQEVVELHRSSQVSILEIGKRLIILKETVLRAKEFRKFVEEEVKFGYDIANKYMELVKRYAIDEDNKENAATVVALGVKKADKLLRISDLETRMKYIKDNDLVNKSFKQVSDLLDKDYPGETGKIKLMKPWTLTDNIENSLNTNLKLINSNMTELTKTRGIDNKIKNEIKTIKTEMEQMLIKVQGLNKKLQELKVKEQEEKKSKDKKTETTA